MSLLTEARHRIYLKLSTQLLLMPSAKSNGIAKAGENIMTSRTTALACLISLSAFGCASFGSAKSSAVRTRAAFDLSCAADKLQVSPLSSEMMERATYGVSGCGKKATYIYAPEGGVILNSPIEASSVAAAESPKAL